MKMVKTAPRNRLRLLMTRWRRRYSTSWQRCRARRRTTRRRTGQMTKRSFCNGPYRSTVGERVSRRRSWTRMTGYRLPISYLAGMTRNVSTSLTRTKSRQYRRVIGSRERMKSWYGLLETMELSSGARLPINLTPIWRWRGTANNAENVGSISWIQRSRKTRSVWRRTFWFWRKDWVLVISGQKSLRKCLGALRIT